MIDLQSIANDWANGQLAAIKLDAAAQADSARRYLDMRKEPEVLSVLGEDVASCVSGPAFCPSYGCDAVLGPDSGIIDGDRYCADCVANEAEVAGREERLRDAELRARGIF